MAKALAVKEDTPDSWAALKRATRIARRKYFDRKVEEVASENKRPWDLMNWVGPRNTLSLEGLSFNGKPCETKEQVFEAFHSSFHAASNHSALLEKIDDTLEQATLLCLVPLP